MDVALIALVVLWWALIAYAVLGGADFGAGVWDFFARGRLADRQRDLINHALGPVWEANHVWLIFLIVGLFTIFPVAFAALSIALFFPMTIVLIGIVFRGAAFIYRYYAVRKQGSFARSWGRVFSVSSLISPFFLGISAAAVASGKLLPADGVPDATYTASWTTPFALVIGAMAVALCATLAAIYLTVEARDIERDLELAESYRHKALIAAAITAILGALGLLLSPSESPILWRGMLERGLVVVIMTLLIGLATAFTLFTKRYFIARILIIAEAAFMLGAWGLSQYPYIIPSQYTISNAANESNVIIAALIGMACGIIILIPSLYYLFAVFKFPSHAPGLQPEGRAARKEG